MTKAPRKVLVVSAPKSDGFSLPLKPKGRASEGTLPSSSSSSSSRPAKESLLVNGKTFEKYKLTSRDDFSALTREVHALGSKSLTGYAKKLYKEEQYRTLMGGTKELKRTVVPLKIITGMIKKTKEKETKRVDEARRGGVVIEKGRLVKKRGEREVVKRVSDKVGPGPSLGFMKGGVLKVER